MDEKARSWLVFTIIGISGVLALSVIVLPLILPIFVPLSSAYQVPESIKEWGGIIIGFYFGASINLIKDLITMKPSVDSNDQILGRHRNAPADGAPGPNRF